MSLQRGDPDPARFCDERHLSSPRSSSGRLKLFDANLQALAAMVVLVLDLRRASPGISFQDVVRRGRRADRRTRELGRASRPDFSSRVMEAQRLSYCGAVAVTTPGRDPRDRAVLHLDLPFPPHRRVLAARQCHRGADLGAVDSAVGRRRLSADAVRAGTSRTGGADGVRHRRDDLGRPARRRAAGQSLGDAAIADGRDDTDRAGWPLALPVAAEMALYAGLAGIAVRRGRRSSAHPP